MTYQLIEIPHGKRGRHGPHVWAELTMAWREPRDGKFIPSWEPITMRNTYTITLQVDIMSNDAERQQVFTELVQQLARNVYGQAAMLSKRPPKLTVKHLGFDGVDDINVFEGEEFNSGE